MHKRKQFSSSERATVAIIATNLLGWQTNLTKQAKNRIALATCSLVSYDIGIKKVVRTKSLKNWMKLATKIRETMPWLRSTEAIYLVMDNAGGDGIHKTSIRIVQCNYYLAISVPTRGKCLGSWHLDEHSSSSGENASQQKKRSRWTQRHCKIHGITAVGCQEWRQQCDCQGAKRLTR
jgi:hypothetical protein